MIQKVQSVYIIFFQQFANLHFITVEGKEGISQISHCLSDIKIESQSLY